MNTKAYNGWTTNLADGYKSLAHKIGTPEDITAQTIQNTSGIKLSTQPHILENIFDTQSLGEDVILIPISDAFKEGRTLKNEFLSESDNKLKFNEYYICIDTKIKEALQYAGVYGGSYIVVSSKDQLFEDELIVKTGSIDDIIVLDPTELYRNNVNGSPLSKNYMKPDSYHEINTGTYIHPSRVFYVDGEKCSRVTRRENQGLGLSKYERIAPSIQNLTIALNRALNIMAKMHQDVIAMNGLNTMLKTDEGTDAVFKRLTYVNKFKSVLSTLAIDGEDTYSNVSKSLGGITDIIEKLMMIVSSASKTPMTKLFGKSPDGQNATGEGDLTNYYDYVMSSIIKAKIAPIYAFLDPIVTKHLFDTDEVIDYEFIPLYTLNEIEIADIAKKEAETHGIYKDMGVVTERDVLLTLQKQGKYEDVEQGEHGDEFEEDENESTYPKNEE